MKKYIYLSLIFLCLALLLYFFQIYFYMDAYRKYFSIATLLVFYPSLFISVIFSIKSLVYLRNNPNKENRVIYFILSSLSILFLSFIIIKLLLVLN